MTGAVGLAVGYDLLAAKATKASREWIGVTIRSDPIPAAATTTTTIIASVRASCRCILVAAAAVRAVLQRLLLVAVLL